MPKRKIFFVLLTAIVIALGVAWSFPFAAQAAKKPTVLVVNTTPGQWGLCCGGFAAAKNKGTYFDALFKHLGYTNGVDFKEVQDVNDFDKELFGGKWDIFVVSYHGWRDSPALQGWVKKKDKDLEQWLKNAHGGVLSTGGRDPEDAPLAKLLGFGEALVAAVAADKCCIKMIPNTPLSKGMAEKLDTSTSGDPSLFGDGQAYDKGKLPKGAEVAAVSLQDDKNVAIAYGRFGSGGYVLASAEITNLDMGFGQPEMSKDSFTLWKNIVDWFASGGLSVESSGKLPTSWGRIKAEY